MSAASSLASPQRRRQTKQTCWSITQPETSRRFFMSWFNCQLLRPGFLWLHSQLTFTSAGLTNGRLAADLRAAGQFVTLRVSQWWRPRILHSSSISSTWPCEMNRNSLKIREGGSDGEKGSDSDTEVRGRRVMQETVKWKEGSQQATEESDGRTVHDGKFWLLYLQIFTFCWFFWIRANSESQTTRYFLQWG